MAAAAPAPSPAYAKPSLSARQLLPHPMLWVAVAFAGGSCWARFFASHFWTPPNWQIIGAAAVILCSLIIVVRPALSEVCALAAVALISVAQTNLAGVNSAEPFPAALENQEVEVTGVVTRASLPKLQETLIGDTASTLPRERYQQVDVLISKIGPIDGVTLPAPRGLAVRVSTYEFAGPEEVDPATRVQLSLHYGQLVRIRGRLRTAGEYQDPGTFQYRDYLLKQGISAVIGTKPGAVQILPGLGGSFWGRLRDSARRSLLQHVLALQSSRGQSTSILSLSERDTALLAAMLLGERSLLDQESKLDFQRTGSYHLLVVSGMAVAVLSFAAYRVFLAVGIPEMVATLLSALFILSYVSITDLGAPVQRAALMGAVYLLARLLYRDRDALNAIGIAGLVVLVVDSQALFDSSFQMTFLAVLTIAGIAIPILERSTRKYRAALHQLDAVAFDLHLKPQQAQFRVKLRMILSRLELFIPRGLARLFLLGSLTMGLRLTELIVISALMQAALAAPMAIYFHRATTLALPANLLVVPLVSMLLPCAMASTLLSYVGTWPAWPAKCVTAILLHLTQAAVTTFAHLHTSEWRVPEPPVWAVVTCIVAISVCILLARQRLALVAMSVSLLGITTVLLYARRPDVAPGELEITAIDVGQGDSLLLVLPDGKSLLIDGGGTLGTSTSGFDVGEDVVSPYLWDRGFSRLDAVALSHAHGDHIGGLRAVLKNFHPSELWIAPGPSTSALEALIQQAHAAGIRVRNRVAGQSFAFGAGHFDVLAPTLDATPAAKRDNDDSMVLRVQYGNTAALLEGDAEKRTERVIAPELGPLNLLKVAHHGSSTSSIPELLQRTHPQFAVISVGRLNRYGHPTTQVLRRIGEAGACLFRTDLDGAVSFYLDGTEMRQVRWGRERAIMNFPSQWIPPQQVGHCAGSQ